MTALGEHTSHQLAHRLCGKCGAYLAGEQGCSEPTCQAVDVQAKDHLFLELPVDTQSGRCFKVSSHILVTYSMNEVIL